ncbi:hypothetical protein OG802_32820 [Streptomyces sp. NBC_00704]|uniref:hypothetical protein n=1 Tax=Streptomyces sp. NBC_00704 TaxID=2975809 RepID=UPI002E31537D|nr:hypothetical protein [Streptomyces sp. NBC_00704]
MAEDPALPHIPHAELAARALDGGRALWDDEAARHLRRCRTCRERLAGYERAVAAGRLTRPGEILHAPPARVWAAIRSRLADDGSRTPPAPDPTPQPARRTGVRPQHRRSEAVRAVVRRLARPLARVRARLRPGRPRGTDR